MAYTKTPQFKRAEKTTCPRCLSAQVLESRRNPLEDVLHAFLGLLPCRCMTCMNRFHALRMPAWIAESIPAQARKTALQ